MNNFAEKNALIQKIQKFHPGECPKRYKDKGWAWYVGGMRDDGGWDYEKMIFSSVKELTQCLKSLEWKEKRRKAAANKPQVPLEEWLAKAKEDVIWESMVEHAKKQSLAFFSGKPPVVSQAD